MLNVFGYFTLSSRRAVGQHPFFAVWLILLSILAGIDISIW
jgi:hypothetical protein